MKSSTIEIEHKWVQFAGKFPLNKLLTIAFKTSFAFVLVMLSKSVFV